MISKSDKAGSETDSTFEVGVAPSWDHPKGEGQERALYGSLPEDCGLIDLSPVEMMFWMYCPIITPTSLLTLPANLRQFAPIVSAVLSQEGAALDDRYVYLTAKTLWVSGDHSGNRPGWHSDGFGTDDVNYIWYDRAPTEFIHHDPGFALPEGCVDAMAYMAFAAETADIVTYPAKHLLRLTPSVIHRSPTRFAPGMRTFVKVSISRDRYDLEGNSINHGLAERWPLVPRRVERNHPSSAAGQSLSEPIQDGARTKSPNPEGKKP